MADVVAYIAERYARDEHGWARVFARFGLSYPGVNQEFILPLSPTPVTAVLKRSQRGNLYLTTRNEGQVAYTVVDLFFALYYGAPLEHIGDGSLYVRTAARLLAEVGDIPAYALAEAIALRRYRGFNWRQLGLTSNSAKKVAAVLEALHDDLLLGAIARMPVGHSVDVLRERVNSAHPGLNLRKDEANHALHLLCLAGVLRKDEQLFSIVRHRPDRFWVRAGVTLAETASVIGRLRQAGFRRLRDLSADLVKKAGFDPTGIYRRGRELPREVKAELAGSSYYVERLFGRKLSETRTKYPENYAHLLPPGCEVKKLFRDRKDGRWVYGITGPHACHYQWSYDLDTYSPMVTPCPDSKERFLQEHAFTPVDKLIIPHFVATELPPPKGYSYVPIELDESEYILYRGPDADRAYEPRLAPDGGWFMVRAITRPAWAYS